MIKKVYLMWNSYNTNENLTIGSLFLENQQYVFQFEEDAIRAMEYGCMLPFIYTNEKIYFDSLPQFFASRKQKKEILDKMGVIYNINDELSILTAFNGIKNTDNFMVVTEEMHENLKKENSMQRFV